MWETTSVCSLVFLDPIVLQRPRHLYTVCALIFAGFIFCGFAIFAFCVFIKSQQLVAVVLKYSQIYGVSPYTIIV